MTAKRRAEENLDPILSPGLSLPEKLQKLLPLRADSELSQWVDSVMLERIAHQQQALVRADNNLRQAQLVLDKLSAPPWYPACFLRLVQLGLGACLHANFHQRTAGSLEKPGQFPADPVGPGLNGPLYLPVQSSADDAFANLAGAGFIGQEIIVVKVNAVEAITGDDALHPLQDVGGAVKADAPSVSHRLGAKAAAVVAAAGSDERGGGEVVAPEREPGAFSVEAHIHEIVGRQGQAVEQYKRPLQIDLEKDYTRSVVKRISDEKQVFAFRKMLDKS